MKVNCELIQQGAEARIYFLDYIGFPAVWKERFVKTYRHPQLDERLTKSRMKAEVKAINHLKNKSAFLSKSMPTILGVSDSSIIMTRIENAATFHEAISSEFFSLQDLFQRVGMVIAEVHKCGLVHGDLTTTNFMVKNDVSAIVPIDFGLSSFSTTPEDRAVDLYVLERSLLTSGRDDSDLFSNFLLDKYKKEMESIGISVANAIVSKLDEVRARGRKRDMVG
ncbi:EKC/KEOPS complex subunit Tp53rkb-like [Panonychus citri]|uniref:EKC/KEOPS complex subunit Tp53rkb-like n=1 Tax=Panonychus citri TaxID=50023 RepID=UPI0023079A13|nr:EKC/KEOPS complex subunit Tp53rkb-like [Panonychus citri]XP_053214742.1 EKC/KEOPS complex subunit Tp53rkb-like [Panonychus citri]